MSTSSDLYTHTPTHTHPHTHTHTHTIYQARQPQQPLLQRATAPELSVQNHSSPSSSLSRPPHPQERAHRVVGRSQSESVTHSVAKPAREMGVGRLKSEASLLKRPEPKGARSSEQRRSDHSTASAEEVARRMVSQILTLTCMSIWTLIFHIYTYIHVCMILVCAFVYSISDVSKSKAKVVFWKNTQTLKCLKLVLPPLFPTHAPPYLCTF